MHWRINASGAITGNNSATDADEDIAFALVMADKQWGGYTTTATNMLNTVAMNDFGTDGTIRAAASTSRSTLPTSRPRSIACSPPT